MKELLEKLKIVLLELEKEHGAIFLFALFQRDNPLELWDLVVSAEWLRFGDVDSIKIVASKVQERVTGKELLKISHVVTLDHDDPTVVYLRSTYDVPNGHPEEVIDCEALTDKLRFVIKRAYLIRCKKIAG